MSSSALLTTPFPLGAYIGNPVPGAIANQTFMASYSSFVTTMGAVPQYIDSFIDYSQPVSGWVNNSSYQAYANAQSAASSIMDPVIALPMASTAAGSMTKTQQYEAFASGKYDSVLTGIVNAWVQQGFTNLTFRPGWEMNLQGDTYAGDSPQEQAVWVKAFQHIYTVLHQAAAADGATVQVVWNPSVTNYSNAEATTNLYPGNNYVDVIGADAYSEVYPYSDYPNVASYHDWNTGKEDSSVAQFIADPVNRMHYWSYPAATKWALDGSGGHSQSLTSLLQFAEAQGKPFALPETGAGNSVGGTDVSDDAAFPEWLSQQLVAAQATGLQIAFVNIWDSNGGGSDEFSFASDDKPLEAAAWAKYFGAQPQVAVATPAAPALSAGPDTLALSVSEDAWQGDAQFIVSVDGQQIGGTRTATASHGAGQAQVVDLVGSFGAGIHTVSVNFLNDAYAGPGADRNLYVGSASLNGTALPGAALTMLAGGPQSFTFIGPNTPDSATPPVITLGSGPDTLALTVAEDAWQGNAMFTVSVDGQQIGDAQTAVASRAAGQSQVVDVMGSFGAGSHTVAVTFLNDAYGGSATADRNLYIEGASLNAAALAGGSLALLAGGPQSFSFTGPNTPAAAAPATITLGSGPDTLELSVAEDAWQGNAMFTVSVDGQQVGGTQIAVASHGAGQSQLIDVLGSFGAGSHTAVVNFVNDSYGGSAATDRNLYVNGATIDGSNVANSGLALMAGGPQGFSFARPVAAVPATGPADTLVLDVSEDAWQGDAQFTVTIDGAQVGGVYTATASHGAGATTAVPLSGTWGPGAHTVGISFINDAWGGSAATDRNLYVDQVTYDGTAASGAPAALLSTGSANFLVPGTSVAAATALTLHLAEDAYQGDAQYSVAVDGHILVPFGTATASASAGQSQSVALQDLLSPGKHDLAISFLNDLYGGSAASDRNLYVAGVDVNGTPAPGATASLLSNGTTHLFITVPNS